MAFHCRSDSRKHTIREANSNEEDKSEGGDHVGWLVSCVKISVELILLCPFIPTSMSDYRGCDGLIYAPCNFHLGVPKCDGICDEYIHQLLIGHILRDWNCPFTELKSLIMQHGNKSSSTPYMYFNSQIFLDIYLLHRIIFALLKLHAHKILLINLSEA